MKIDWEDSFIWVKYVQTVQNKDAKELLKRVRSKLKKEVLNAQLREVKCGWGGESSSEEEQSKIFAFNVH